jgi:hypothetical protein
MNQSSRGDHSTPREQDIPFEVMLVAVGERTREVSLQHS